MQTTENPYFFGKYLSLASAGRQTDGENPVRLVAQKRHYFVSQRLKKVGQE
ncbi:MAG: hypothetical protein NTX45_12800 [Proteobacteria bacterium]|nr:hypothetical protein [Pseudomonadota bacterium]